MDMFSIHVYGESPRIPPSLRHPRTTSIGIADYDKLVSLLGRAFDGTAQSGSKLPLVYGEYGVETTVPADKQSAYTGQEVVKTVDDATQAQYYAQAISLAACQRTVRNAAALFPRARRAAVAGTAERPLLRGRDAEAEPRQGAARDRPPFLRRLTPGN